MTGAERIRDLVQRHVASGGRLVMTWRLWAAGPIPKPGELIPGGFRSTATPRAGRNLIHYPGKILGMATRRDYLAQFIEDPEIHALVSKTLTIHPPDAFVFVEVLD